MGSSVSVVDGSEKKQFNAEDNARKLHILNNTERLSVANMKELCQIEENHDPSKQIFHMQIFNTLKEWDDKVSFRLLLC